MREDDTTEPTVHLSENNTVAQPAEDADRTAKDDHVAQTEACKEIVENNSAGPTENNPALSTADDATASKAIRGAAVRGDTAVEPGTDVCQKKKNTM